MHQLPVATHLAVESVRRRFDPNAEPEYHYDPIRFPRLRPARAAVAAILHAVARAVAPPVDPRLSSVVCRE